MPALDLGHKEVWQMSYKMKCGHNFYSGCYKLQDFLPKEQDVLFNAVPKKAGDRNKFYTLIANDSGLGRQQNLPYLHYTFP
jgi:hypothetical protein